MKMPIAFKVVSVYLVIVIGSLGLSGLLANGAIQNYVISAMRQNLLADGREVIAQFEAYGQMATKQAGLIGSGSDFTIAAQNVNREYIVVDPSGTILWNTFSEKDSHMLSKVRDVVVQAMLGHIATGVYPPNNPVFEFVAIPFNYTQNPTLRYSFPGLPHVMLLPGGQSLSHTHTKVVALFARLSDLQRISSQIWSSVAQGLLIASLVTAIVGVVMARRLMRPAQVIKLAIDRVREHDFTDVPVIHTGDEWEDFSTAFGEMVHALQSFDEGQKRFLQNASHELKTPLMAIRGYAEGLRDGVFEQSESFRILDIVAQESVRLKNLVDELIYLSKLETLDEVYTFVQYDLTLIIYKTIERVHPLAKEREIHILPDVPEDPVYVLIDRDKMVQALLNLASNAIRHARRQIMIRLSDQNGVTLIVEDDGEGFHDDDADRVFERFFHGSKGDTGLGLPIARAIVEKHRGQIFAENVEGQGARFVIQLPAQTS